jgi:hypothetical protein
MGELIAGAGTSQTLVRLAQPGVSDHAIRFRGTRR